MQKCIAIAFLHFHFMRFIECAVLYKLVYLRIRVNVNLWFYPPFKHYNRKRARIPPSRVGTDSTDVVWHEAGNDCDLFVQWPNVARTLDVSIIADAATL